MKNTKHRTLFAALLLAPLAALHAADCYVAPTGNDANQGTKAKPLATIQAGVNALQPGATLLVRGRVYRETVTFPWSGTAEKPITVKPYKGEKVIVIGCEPVTGWTLHDGGDVRVENGICRLPHHPGATKLYLLTNGELQP